MTYKYSKWKNDFCFKTYLVICAIVLVIVSNLVWSLTLDNVLSVAMFLLLTWCVWMVGTAYKTAENYDVTINESSFSGANSYSVFFRPSSINLNDSFSVKSSKSWVFPFRCYEVSQGDQKVQFSEIGLRKTQFNELLLFLNKRKK